MHRNDTTFLLFYFQENLEGRILGCVKEITDWGLIIELPNFLSASVHITEISDVYSDLLEKYSNGTVEVSLKKGLNLFV